VLFVPCRNFLHKRDGKMRRSNSCCLDLEGHMLLCLFILLKQLEAGLVRGFAAYPSPNQARLWKLVTEQLRHRFLPHCFTKTAIPSPPNVKLPCAASSVALLYEVSRLGQYSSRGSTDDWRFWTMSNCVTSHMRKNSDSLPRGNW
jgi:hypothetical protein